MLYLHIIQVIFQQSLFIMIKDNGIKNMVFKFNEQREQPANPTDPTF